MPIKFSKQCEWRKNLIHIDELMEREYRLNKIQFLVFVCEWKKLARMQFEWRKSPFSFSINKFHKDIFKTKKNDQSHGIDVNESFQ